MTNAHQAPPRATTRHQTPREGCLPRPFDTYAPTPHEKLTRDLYPGLQAPPSATKRHQAQPTRLAREQPLPRALTNQPTAHQRQPSHTRERPPGINQQTNGAPTPTKPREGGLPRPFDKCAPNATQGSKRTSTPGNEPRALPRTRSTRLTSFAVLQSYCLAVLHASPGMALPAFTLVWGHFYLGLDTRHQKRTKRQIRAFAGDACPGLSTHAHQAPHVAHERSLPRAFTHTQRLRSKRNTRAYARDCYPSLYTRIWGQFYLGL